MLMNEKLVDLSVSELEEIAKQEEIRSSCVNIRDGFNHGLGSDYPLQEDDGRLDDLRDSMAERVNDIHHEWHESRQSMCLSCRKIFNENALDSECLCPACSDEWDDFDPDEEEDDD